MSLLSSMLGVRLMSMAAAAEEAACCLTALPSLAAPRSRLLWLNDLGS